MSTLPKRLLSFAICLVVLVIATACGNSTIQATTTPNTMVSTTTPIPTSVPTFTATPTLTPIPTPTVTPIPSLYDSGEFQLNKVDLTDSVINGIKDVNFGLYKNACIGLYISYTTTEGAAKNFEIPQCKYAGRLMNPDVPDFYNELSVRLFVLRDTYPELTKISDNNLHDLQWLREHVEARKITYLSVCLSNAKGMQAYLVTANENYAKQTYTTAVQANAFDTSTHAFRFADSNYYQVGEFDPVRSVLLCTHYYVNADLTGQAAKTLYVLVVYKDASFVLFREPALQDKELWDTTGDDGGFIVAVPSYLPSQ